MHQAKLFLIISFFSPVFTFAQQVTVTVANYSNNNSYIVSTSTKYTVPKINKRTLPKDANYTIFPEKIDWKGDGYMFVVSRKWQTACLYNSSSTIAIKNDKPFCMQLSTGKKDFPTELGLYNIQTKQDKNYRSTLYSPQGEIKPEDKDKNIGTPMPYAMHIGRIIGKLQDGKLLYDFSDGTAIHEKLITHKNGSIAYVSHGCLAVEKGEGKVLQSYLKHGNLTLVFDEVFPKSLDEAISISK